MCKDKNLAGAPEGRSRLTALRHTEMVLAQSVLAALCRSKSGGGHLIQADLPDVMIDSSFNFRVMARHLRSDLERLGLLKR